MPASAQRIVLLRPRTADPALEVTIDLVAQQLRAPGVPATGFAIDGFARRCLVDIHKIDYAKYEIWRGLTMFGEGPKEPLAETP